MALPRLRGFRRPSWARPFVQEFPHDCTDEAHLQGLSTAVSTILLLFLAVVDLCLQATAATLHGQCIPNAVASGLVVLYVIAVRPRTVSALLTGLVIATFVGQAVVIYKHVQNGVRDALLILEGVALVASASCIFIAFNAPFRDPKLSRKGISKPYSQPHDNVRSPEDNLTLWQWTSVSWMLPLLNIGRKRKLEPADVWKLPYEFQHARLHENFRSLRGGVVRRLLRANWIDLAIMTVIALAGLAAEYSIPLVLQQLLLAMQQLPTVKGPALLFTSIILVLRYTASQTYVLDLWYARRCYERSRGEMITMVYEKTLQRKIIGAVASNTETTDQSLESPVLSDESTNFEPRIESDESEPLLRASQKEESGLVVRLYTYVIRTLEVVSWRRRQKKVELTDQRKPASMGKILNIMRNDIYEVAQRFWEFEALIDQPAGMILSFALLWRLLGWACIMGVVVILFTQALTALLAKLLVKWETVRRKASDQKLQQISQYVEAIRHLRYYAWNHTWLERIMSARQKELNLRVITSIITAVIHFVQSVGSGILPVAAFWAYTTTMGGHLTVDVAFPALELFALLQANLRELPGLITTLSNAYVAVGRIEDFMSEPDKEDSGNKDIELGEEFEFKSAAFAWPGNSDAVLRDLSLTFPNGLTLIYGQVAAGKSALLQALLGEMDLHSGKLVRPSSAVAFCAQSPWLQSMSIRDNILFGSDYDDQRYKATLFACALLQDLAALQHGDLSPIGENGIGLSGGQKMRVALARAVYSHADSLLLDDPLSALDQQTAEHIVKECLQGPLLRGRTIILVTHRVDLCLPVAEQVIEIEQGRAVVCDAQRESISEHALARMISHQAVEQTMSAREQDEAAAIPEKFEEEEHRADGNVQVKVYWEYIKAGRIIWWVVVLMTSAVTRLVAFSESWFLKEWSEAYNVKALWHTAVQNQWTLSSSGTPLSRLLDRLPDPSTHPEPWLLGLMILVLIESILYFIAKTSAVALTYVAGKNLFERVMKRVSHATFRFYDVTPIGRLMNRLTSDMGTVDVGVSEKLTYVLYQLMAWVTSLVVIALVTPAFLITVGVITVLYIYTIMLFVPTSQSLRRLEMVSLSPLMSNFGALLEGLMTVRAFCVQSQFQDRIIATTDAFQQMDHFYWSLQAWLLYRFGVLSAVSTAVLTLIAIYSGLSAGLTAFMLVAADRLVSSTEKICRAYGELQLEFVAVERIVEMLDLDQEEPGSQAPPASWPSAKDDIVFKDVTLRYAPHLEPSLHSISLSIPGGSSTALIGRTGSGKSTLALSLLATLSPDEGSITIGGIDINRVDKQALRSRITFLAQDPVLFPGSLRHNLDPNEEHTDTACEDVIERVCGTYGFTLSTEIDTGGKNLSQGQRQLVGLARAILRRSSIIIMDEATASIDRETAWEIQRVLREELVGSTVITIAHRPSAVRGADLCIKLAGGKLEAFGRPDEIVPGDVGGVYGAAREVI